MVRRVVLGVVGAFLLIVGLCLAVAGGLIMAITGSDDTIRTGSEPLSTTSTALVTEVADISGTGGTADAFSQPDLRLALSGSNGPAFVGIGPAADVDRYLAGTSIERVDDFRLDPFRLRTTPVAGTARPAAPDAQSFWVARSTGTNPTLDWKITDGRYRLVLMNADAAPGVAVDARVELRVPHLFGIGIGILVAGLVLLPFGVLFVVLAARTGRHPTPVAFGAAPATGQWPGHPGPGDGPPRQSWPLEQGPALGQESRPTSSPRPPNG